MLVSIGNLIDDVNRQSSWNNLLINTVEILFETTLGVKKGDVIDMDFILPEKVVYDGVCMDKYGNIKVRCYHFKKDGKPRKNPSFERWSCFYCSYKPNKQNSVSDDLDKEIERFWTTKFPQGYKENTPLTLTHGEHISLVRYFARIQRRLLVENAWSEGTLQDWFISSVDNTIPPVWTEKHIKELCDDFYVINKKSV